MSEAAVLIGIILGLILIVLSSHRLRRRAPAPADQLRRLHPGVADKAEWMAPDSVVQRVIADYMAAQQWLGDAQLSDYFASLRDLPRYFSGACLAEQHRLLRLQLQRGRKRFAGILRAHHTVSVRRFSDDGLSCLLIDQQTERRMATYDYWTKARLHTQDLGSGTLIFRMVLDRSNGRWKVDEFIQQLPQGWETLSGSTLRITDALPMAAGRDI